MTDLDISRAVALAIGWKPGQMQISGECLLVTYDGFYWHNFDYRDWRVIGPIAEKWNGCFPYFEPPNKWSPESGIYSDQDTPQKAIAIDVIGGWTT